MMHRILLACVLLLVSIPSMAQDSSAAFDGIEKWKGSLTDTAITSLKGLYSTDPPAKFVGKDRKPAPDISPEINFWQELVSAGANGIEVNTLEEGDQQGLHIVSLAVAMKMKTADGPRTRYVNEQQAWQQQGDRWRIVVATHSDVVKMPPALKRNP